MIERILSPELVDALGWTILHSLWQGAGYALVLGVALVLMRNYSPQARHFTAAGLLGAFVLTALFTFSRLYTQAEPVGSYTITTSHENAKIKSDNGVPVAPLPYEPEIETSEVAARSDATIGFIRRAEGYFDRHLPLIVTFWMMGILILLLRFLGQLAYVQRLKSYGTRMIPPEWEERLRELEEHLNVTRKVTYLLSQRSESPFTVGWLKPYVILPADLFAKLTDTQIYNILAHELAHVARNDYVVNILQQLVTILFFYHPGAWWMSSRIAEEREHCCDDLAVSVTGTRKIYANTLIQLQSTTMNTYSLSLPYAGTTSGFRGRIYRLFATGLSGASFREGVFTTGLLVMSIAAGLSLSQLPQSPQTTMILVLGTESASSEASNTSIQGETDPELQALIEAIVAGDQVTVNELIKNEALLDGEDKDGFTPLMWAAWGDQEEIAKTLLLAGVDLNHRNKFGWTALMEAADEDAQNTLRLLLSAGAEVNSKSNKWNVTALSMAASENHREIFDLLVEAGAVLEASQAIHAAAEEGNLPILRYMVEDLGADVDETDFRGRTAISYAAEEDKDQVVAYLLKVGASLNIADDRGKLPIDYAVSEDAESTISVITQSPKNRDETLKQEMIFEASANGNVALLGQLISAGFEVNVRNKYGRTPLMEAVREGEAGAINFLLAAGADINATREANGFSALTVAVLEEEPAIISLLIAKGADLKNTVRVKHISMSSGEGESSVEMSIHENIGLLMVAVREASPEALGLLLDYGLDPNVTSSFKEYDINRDITKNDGSLDLDHFKAITQENAAHTELRATISGWTPLMEAALMGEENLVTLLLAKGANRNLATNTGLTATQVARREGHEALAEKLE